MMSALAALVGVLSAEPDRVLSSSRRSGFVCPDLQQRGKSCSGIRMSATSSEALFS
jgi:hypothetical protein